MTTATLITPTLITTVALIAALACCTKPLGRYIAGVMNADADSCLALRAGMPLETRLYRWLRIDATREMTWNDYALAVLAFSVIGALLAYTLQRLQVWLPLNPQQFAAVSSDSAFNTAVSFVTNTNWQGYSGESTMSYLTQMAALTVQNFASAVTGLAVAMALIRGLAGHATQTLGNFWRDITRGTLYVLLPLAAILALALVACGVIQNFDHYQTMHTLQSAGTQQLPQQLPMGPVASQEAIKELGTNGGGFMNANSAHPFENPNGISNLLEMFALLLIPFALSHSFGHMVGDTRQGWAVLAAMVLMLSCMATLAIHAEQQGNPAFASLHIDQSMSALQGGGNLEGKEVRYGSGISALFATLTTGTSTGAVISMHDSLMPLGGLATLVMMQLGEVSPGGVGTGLYSMLLFALIAVFMAGLMIGRTPEYLGKKIETWEMKMAAIAILVTPFIVLLGTAIALSTPAGRAGIANPGAHGFSEVLYAFTSAGNNNGSAFAGLSANTPFYNTLLGIAMWLGRFWMIVPVLAIAGSLAGKKRLAVTEGTLPTHGPLFVVLLTGTVLLVGLLTYVPALALGPVIEQLLMH